MSPHYIPVFGMLFVLLLVLIIGGVLPLMKRLGAVAEGRLEARQPGSQKPTEELRELQDVVQSLQSEVERLAEQQQFMERLLEDKPPLIG